MDLEQGPNRAINRINNNIFSYISPIQVYKIILVIVNSGATKNHIILEVVERLRIPYKEKKKPYLLVIILGELVLYKDRTDINRYQKIKYYNKF